MNIDYAFKIEDEESETFLNYLSLNARLDSLKLKLNVETVPNEEMLIKFLQYMRHLTTCRDLYIEEYDGAYLHSLV